MEKKELNNFFNQGLEGEEIARKFLSQYGIHIFIPDGLFEFNNNIFAIEVKNKEHFKSPPFDGTGLNFYQVKTRMSLFNKKNIRCILISRSPKDEIIYWQFLDLLQKGKKFKTRNNIIIYPLTSFNSIKTLEEVFNDSVLN